MTRYLRLASLGILFCLLFAAKAQASPPIKVVVTLSVLKDLAEQVGKERVEVKSLITGIESEHTYSPKPSDIIEVREARLFLLVGVGLEIWADNLIKNAGNQGLLVVTTGQGIPLLRDREREETEAEGFSIGRHRLGNPHIWLDPQNVKMMLKHITDSLIKLDSGGEAFYLQNQAEYLRKLDLLESKLQEKVARLTDRKIVTYHPAWPYFARRFGFNIRGIILTRVGTEPSAHRLAELIKTMRRQKIKVIASEPQLDQEFPQTIAKETGATVVLLTVLPGAIPGTETYLSMMEYDVDQLVEALSK
jgi:zinc/manganese transport system substrate-binding protein